MSTADISIPSAIFASAVDAADRAKYLWSESVVALHQLLDAAHRDNRKSAASWAVATNALASLSIADTGDDAPRYSDGTNVLELVFADGAVEPPVIDSLYSLTSYTPPTGAFLRVIPPPSYDRAAGRQEVLRLAARYAAAQKREKANRSDLTRAFADSVFSQEA